MKARTKINQIKKAIDGPFGRIIVLTGARQTGKTTLTKNLFKDFSFLSIEDPVLRKDYLKLTSAQWQQLYPKAILDEIQKEPQLIESIKAVYDLYEKPQYILLGSSQLLLMEKVKESLAGRCQIIELFPLTLPEILTHNWSDTPQKSYLQNLLLGEEARLLPSIHFDENHPQKLEAFSNYLKWGAYPALYKFELTDEEKKLWLNNYNKTYLQRDIRDLADFNNLEPFVNVQKMSAILTSQMVNYSSISRNAGVHAKTVQRFISYLEMSYQIILLQPWHKNALKRLSKMPKIHYLDPGVQKAVAQKIYAPINGHEFESAIVAEIYKQAKNLEKDFSFYHLRTSDGREIDFLIETEAGYYAFEIKQTSHVHKTDARHIIGLEEILDKPLIKGFIVSNDISNKEISPNIMAVNIASMLA